MAADTVLACPARRFSLSDDSGDDYEGPRAEEEAWASEPIEPRNERAARAEAAAAAAAAAEGTRAMPDTAGTRTPTHALTRTHSHARFPCSFLASQT
jgi:hypothetical protein